MKKRIICLGISLIMVFSCFLNITAFATNIDDTSVFIKQEGSDWCTYASATNMIRRRALLDGNGNWSTYTDANLRSSARASGGGMSNSFSYAGYGVTAENWKSKSTEQKKSSLISLLTSHPEGVVIYTFDGTYTHAILACNYTNGTFYVNDPAKKKPSGIIKLTEAQFNGSSQDDRIGWIKKVWYISSGSGTGGTYTPTPEPSPTPTPTTPAGISLSTSNVNLDYPNSASKTITVTATGDLPNKYEFEVDMGGYVYPEWGTWSGNTIDLTLTANNDSYSCTAKIYLKNKDTDSVLATVQFNVNVSQPIKKQMVNIYFNSNKGYDAPATIEVEENTSADVPSQTPHRSGYKFIGWNTTSNASSSKYEVGDKIYVGSENITLYAVWEKSDAYLKISEKNIYMDTGEEYSIYATVCGLEYQMGFKVNCDDCIEYDYGEWDADTLTQEIVFKAADDKKSTGKAYIKLFDYESDNMINDGDDECRDIQEVTIHTNQDKKEDFADRNQMGISVYLNGEKLSFDVQPQIINGRTMVPMRKIFESLGTVVGWNNNTQKAISVKKGDVVSVSIGGQYLTVNGEQKLLDSPPVIISGRTLVPVRAIAESFKCDVEWYDYGASQVVDINMKDTVNKMDNRSELRIGWSDFAPFSYVDNYEGFTGFDAELAKYVCQFWGWQPEFIYIPLDQSFPSIANGTVDCYWSAITKTEERMEYATFTNDYVEYLYETEEDGEWYSSHDVYSVPFQKGDYDTVNLVNIALEEAKKDGTIAYLKYKYGIE